MRKILIFFLIYKYINIYSFVMRFNSLKNSSSFPFNIRNDDLEIKIKIIFQ